MVCNFLNVLLLIWHPQRPAYKIEYSRIFLFHLFAIAVLSRLRSLVVNLSFKRCFYVLFTFDAHFRSAPVGRRGATGGTGGGIKIPET